jgi:hypothetical protein
METNRAKEIIVSVLQIALTGKLDPSSNFKPQDVADAIENKINFGKCYNDIKNDKILSNIIDDITNKKNEMKKELENLNKDEKLLINFLLGKLTAYDEILEHINNI